MKKKYNVYGIGNALVDIEFEDIQTYSDVAGLIKERVKQEYDENRKELKKA